MRCTGSESQISDCATSSLTFEEGRKLVKHIGVAGVSCRQHCPITVVHSVTACPMKTNGQDPSQQPHTHMCSSKYVTSTFILAGAGVALAAATVTLTIW